MLRIISLLLAVGIALGACQAKELPRAPAKGEKKMALTITSTAFAEGETVPRQYTCDGPDISPPLAWSGVPKKAKSLALICDDPDAPVGTWVHWVIFNIAADSTGLPEGVPVEPKLATGAVQGKNSWKKVGYGGPCPPPGKPHRYFFKLYALDTVLALDSNATSSNVEKAMKGHVLAEGRLMGTYQR